MLPEKTSRVSACEMDGPTKCHRNEKRTCIWNGYTEKCKKHGNAIEIDQM